MPSPGKAELRAARGRGRPMFAGAHISPGHAPGGPGSRLSLDLPSLPMRKPRRYRARVMKLLSFASVAFALAVVLTACSSTDAGSSGTASAANTVTLNGNSFEPATITIKAGESVTWKWSSGTHDVKSGATCAPDGKFSSGDPEAGATFEHKFDTAGTFDYFCSVHCGSGMVGKVIVQ